MATESQVRRIEVVVNTQGDKTLKTIADGFSKVNKSVANTTNILSRFQNAFLAIQGLSFAGIGIREIVQAADAMQKLGDRLTITEGSAIGAAARLNDLTKVANQNFTSVTDIGTVYNRLSAALGDIGISSEEVITLTDRLSKTFRLSGSTTAEATSAVLQLSQGLASGQVRGQELRSVLEANVVIGKLLSQQLGVTRGELLKFAEKRGGISAADFLNAVANGAKDLDEAASKLRPTIKEGLTRNINTLKLSLNELNKEFGITEIVVAGLDLVFSNLGKILTGAAILAIPTTFKLIATSVATATASLTAFAAVVAGSAVTGVIVKATTIVAGLAGAFATIPIAVTAAVTSFVLAFSTIDDFRNSIIDTVVSVKDFIAIGLKTSLMNDEQKKKFFELKEAAESYEKITKELNKSSGIFVLTQSDLEKQFAKTIEQAEQGKRSLGPIADIFATTSEKAFEAKKSVFDFKTQLSLLNQSYQENSISLEQYNKKLRELKITDLNKEFEEGSFDAEAYNKKLNEINFGKLKTNTKELQFDLKLLNAEFARNNDVGEYAKRLSQVEIDKLSADAKEGKINLIDFNNNLNKEKIKQFNIEFAKTGGNVIQLGNNIRNLELENLERDFRSGTIGIAEFNEETNRLSEKFNPNSALFTGVNNYIQQAGTLSTNIANGITQTFGRLEESFIQFTQTGKFNFREFTRGVLEDLNRIILRSLIIRPLAQGILGAVGASGGASASTAGQTDLATGSTANVAAKGAAFDKTRANFFASGGVVNGATAFGYGGGKLGIMGEAGPEAILPLKRDGQGNLGVKAAPSNVTVNVINQSGAETEQRESTNANGDRIIDILILSKVKEGFSNGAFDKQFAQQYGLRRRGA